MNIEIKFRALDNLGNWIFGIPQNSSTLHLTLDCMAQYFTEQRKYGRENVLIKPGTVGQFTGLKDKKSVEVYKDDLFKDVLNTRSIGVVKYGEYVNCFDRKEIEFGGHVGFYVDFGNEKVRKDLAYWAKNSEVVGNIHESPLADGQG